MAQNPYQAPTALPPPPAIPPGDYAKTVFPLAIWLIAFAACYLYLPLAWMPVTVLIVCLAVVVVIVSRIWYDRRVHCAQVQSNMSGRRVITSDSYAQAMRSYAAGAYDVALVEITRTLQDHPDAADGLLLRGIIYWQLDEIDKAAADWDRAVELEPENPLPRIWRFHISARDQNYERLREDSAVVLAADPNQQDALLLHGIACEQLGACGDAVRCYEQLWPVNSHQSDVACRLARLYACARAETRDGQRAIEVATRACELSSYGDWECLSVLAAAHAEAGDFEQALTWAQETLRLAPFDEKAERLERIRLYERGMPHRLPSN